MRQQQQPLSFSRSGSTARNEEKETRREKQTLFSRQETKERERDTEEGRREGKETELEEQSSKAEQIRGKEKSRQRECKGETD